MPPMGVVSLCNPSSSEEAETCVASKVVKRIDATREFLSLRMKSLLPVNEAVRLICEPGLVCFCNLLLTHAQTLPGPLRGLCGNAFRSRYGNTAVSFLPALDSFVRVVARRSLPPKPPGRFE